MKKFSLLLMIVLIVGAIFVSCSAEPSADATKVATVALSLDTAKELEVDTDIEYLPAANKLYWFYTATKNDSGFKTGETGETLTPIRADKDPEDNTKMHNDLPSVIGYDGTANSGTWFSTGKWIFSFYGYKLPDLDDEDNVLVYQKEDYALTVEAADEETSIGATAEITLELKDDPREGSKFKMGEVYVNLGTAYESNAEYTLTAYVDGTAVKEGIEGTKNDQGKKVTFSIEITEEESTEDILKVFAKETEANPDTGLKDLHLVEFKMYKGDDEETVYASGSIGLIARMGYTYTISGDLDSLESRAQVGINATLPENLDAPNQTITEFTITDEYQLRAFASYVNQGNNCAGMTIKLANDITLTQPWTPIGNSYRGQEGGAYFAGTFDGRKPDNSGNYTISGLRLASDAEVAKDGSNEYVFGLFGVVKNATIENLTMLDVQINQVTGLLGENVAAVVGYSEGSLTLQNITVGAQNDSTSYINGQHVAGVISRAYGKSEGATITISNCANYVNITATNGSDNKAKAAGIAAFVNPNHVNASVTITGCTNNGAISSSASVHVIAAGIASYGFSSNQHESITISGNNIAQTATVSVTSDAENTRQSVDRISVNCGYAADSTDTESAQHGN